jgi:single-stranded DNA-binding protein
VPTKSRTTKSRTTPPGSSLNLCVVRGECSAEPELRVLASGTRLAALSVRVRSAGAPATSVPVAVWDPPAHIETLEAGTEVVVVGRVVRRFFRTSAGGPGSRVEVRADVVVPAGDRRKLAQALRRAERALDALVEDRT